MSDLRATESHGTGDPTACVRVATTVRFALSDDGRSSRTWLMAGLVTPQHGRRPCYALYLGLLLAAAGLCIAGGKGPSYRLKTEEQFVQLMADVDAGEQTVEYAKVAVIDKLAEYGVDDVVRRLDKPGVVPLDGASLPELADALYHAMHPNDLIEPPSEYNECKREYAEDKSRAREVRGLIHSLCAWWGQGVDMLCQQISDDKQCRRFVKDPFVTSPRLRDFTTMCDTNCIDLPVIEMPVSKTEKGSLHRRVASGKQDL